jgi:hypothetical protein
VWSAGQRQRTAAAFLYAVLIRDTDACFAFVSSGGMLDVHACMRKIAIASVRIQGDAVKVQPGAPGPNS